MAKEQVKLEINDNLDSTLGLAYKEFQRDPSLAKDLTGSLKDIFNITPEYASFFEIHELGPIAPNNTESPHRGKIRIPIIVTNKVNDIIYMYKIDSIAKLVVLPNNEYKAILLDQPILYDEKEYKEQHALAEERAEWERERVVMRAKLQAVIDAEEEEWAVGTEAALTAAAKNNSNNKKRKSRKTRKMRKTRKSRRV
jgi:hypothetical protein